MHKTRPILGLVAGVMLILSAAAHSLLGGKEMGDQMKALSLPPDLVRGLLVGWHFGGVAMLAFGVIVLALFLRRLKGETVPSFPAWVIGGCYLAFGLFAFVISSFNPFYSVFIVPAILLLVAAPATAVTRP